MVKDKVKCSWCDAVSYVEPNSEECPMCMQAGFLSDLQQEVEVVEVDGGYLEV